MLPSCLPTIAQLGAKSNLGSWGGWLCHLPASCPHAPEAKRLTHVCRVLQEGAACREAGGFERSGFHWPLGGVQVPTEGVFLSCPPQPVL